MPGRAAVTHQSQISSYSRLVRRVNHALTTPRAMYERQTNLYPGQAESNEDWERLLEEIRDSEGVTMTRREDGSVHVRWRGPAW